MAHKHADHLDAAAVLTNAAEARRKSKRDKSDENIKAILAKPEHDGLTQTRVKERSSTGVLDEVWLDLSLISRVRAQTRCSCTPPPKPTGGSYAYRDVPIPNDVVDPRVF